MNYLDMLQIMPYMQAAQSIGKNPLEVRQTGGALPRTNLAQDFTVGGPQVAPLPTGPMQPPQPRDLGDYPKDERKRATGPYGDIL
jgi:hypothetical protein